MVFLLKRSVLIVNCFPYLPKHCEVFDISEADVPELLQSKVGGVHDVSHPGNLALLFQGNQFHHGIATAVEVPYGGGVGVPHSWPVNNHCPSWHIYSTQVYSSNHQKNIELFSLPPLTISFYNSKPESD